MTRWILTAIALLTALLLTASVPAEAATRALLVGVGEYPGMKRDKQLEGPANDVAALEALLTGKHGVPAENIVTRVDGAATRKEILDALDRLVDAAGAGDFIFFYYSGHGTSAHGSSGLSLDLYTGALYPHDYRTGTPEDTRNRLIIGRRDIKPRLKASTGKGLWPWYRLTPAFPAMPSGPSGGVRAGRAVMSRSPSTASPTSPGGGMVSKPPRRPPTLTETSFTFPDPLRMSRRTTSPRGRSGAAFPPWTASPTEP